MLQHVVEFVREVVSLPVGRTIVALGLAVIIGYLIVAIFANRLWKDIQPPTSAKIEPTQCAKCGYDLRATPDRCPECGTIPTELKT